MIREATQEDLPDFVRMGEARHETALRDKGLGYNRADFVKYSIALIDSPLAVVFGWEKDGKIVGTIAGTLDCWYMDFSQVILIVKWWIVDPEYQGSGIARKLFDALVRWGKSREAVKVQMSHGVEHNEDKEKIIRKYYKRKGFSYLETSFIKEI